MTNLITKLIIVRHLTNVSKLYIRLHMNNQIHKIILNINFLLLQRKKLVLLLFIKICELKHFLKSQLSQLSQLD